ncbi:MAG: CoA transferase, partial [Proteobacteria bacterium]|nr:CoA transferase [Pseudomonadota bacterium]
ADGSIILAVGNDGQFKRFCDVAGRPDLAADPRYQKNGDRLKNRDELVPMLRQIVAAKPSAFWLENLEKNNVSCGPINNLKQVFDDPQVQARGMCVELPHPAMGKKKVKLINSPMKLSGTPTTNRMAPPMLGQHTDEILHELLGLSAAEIAAFRDKDVI